MPAVTVPDLTKGLGCPRRHRAQQRPVRSITTAPGGLEGEGFP